MSINVGIICPSEIAFRRFLPSLQKVKDFSFKGVAIATPEEWSRGGVPAENTSAQLEIEREKAQRFVDGYGGIIYEGYKTLITSPDVTVSGTFVCSASSLYPLYLFVVFILDFSTAIVFGCNTCTVFVSVCVSVSTFVPSL